MPLVKYFGFVGSALVMLLLGISWYFPQSTTESVHGNIDKSTIRISDAGVYPVAAGLLFDVQETTEERQASSG